MTLLESPPCLIPRRRLKGGNIVRKRSPRSFFSSLTWHIHMPLPEQMEAIFSPFLHRFRLLFGEFFPSSILPWKWTLNCFRFYDHTPQSQGVHFMMHILWCPHSLQMDLLGISLVPGLSDSSSRELTAISRTNLVSSWQQNQDFWSIWFLRFGLVAQAYLTLCNPMDCGAPGFLVHNQILELAQIHVHLVSDAVQTSHPLSFPTPPAFSLSQHQGLF